MGLSDALSTLNSPPLVAASGIATAALLPALEKAILENRLTFTHVKILNCLAFLLNVFATQQPGRIDGMQQEEFERIIKTPNLFMNVPDQRFAEMIKAIMPDRRGRSLVIPSPWAFAMWGPIFLGEFIFCLGTALMKRDSVMVPLVQDISASFVASQVFQVLWTASFRPKYARQQWIVVSGFMLSGIALSLARAHAEYSKMQPLVTWKQYLVYLLPLTLHFGWTTAAALVNFNGTLAMPSDVSAKLLAVAGWASAVGAAVLGVGITLRRGAPMYGGVLAWALVACGTGVMQRLQDIKFFDSKMAAGLYGARTMKWLSFVGAAASAAASIFVAWRNNA
jgi:hypothetical protein